MSVYKSHPGEAQALCTLQGALVQLGTRFDADELGALERRLAQEELVQNEAEVSIAGAGVEKLRLRVAPGHVEQRRLEQLHEVVHLLQLAQRIGVQGAVAADQVQLAQQLDGLAGQELAAE